MVNNQHEMASDCDVSEHRRRLLQSLGIAGVAGMTGLAGCTGQSDTPQNTDSGNGGSTDTPEPDNLEGTTFEFWDMLNVQTGSAREAVVSHTNQWKSETGAKVKLNLASYAELLGTKWVQSFQNGQPPHIYNADAGYSGKLIKGGWVKPVSEWRDKLGPEINSAIEWILPIVRHSNRGFGELYEIPVAWNPRNPLVARMDHFEEAGLDPEEDFPPRDYEHLVEVATTLQEDGPGEVGFQIFGNQYDWQDVMGPWAVANGGKDGLPLNEDWSDVNYDNEVWIETATQMNDIFNKYGLGIEGTPTAADEQVVPLMTSGKLSMSMPEILNHPEFMSVAPDMMKDGTIQYAPSFGGPANQPGWYAVWSFGVVKPPEGANQAAWNQELEAAIQYLRETWFSKEWQRKFPETMGMFPVRDDVWSEVDMEGGEGHKLVDAVFGMQEQMDYSWSNYPNGIPLNTTIPAKYIQKMLKGELTPEEAMTQTANEIRNQVL